MKVSLEVLTPGKMEGKTIGIGVSQFVIGRDPQCNLRPASPLISKRHCLIETRNNQAIVRDFGSTNGTYVNDERVDDEHDLQDEDVLKVGPLEFRVTIETSLAPSKPTPAPNGTLAHGARVDDAAAELLLGDDDSIPNGAEATIGNDGIPTGSTVMDVLAPDVPVPSETTQRTGGADRERAAKAAQGNTSTAARAILDKYMRRPRS
jgi:pSer/pThr/pTyr-binding forkhead associated (FHA) protein